jgi:hypothetical protein
MYKQISQSNTVNEVNRLSTPLKGRTFLGFKRVYWGNRWGLPVEGHNFCAVYSWDKPVKTTLTRETKEASQLEAKEFFPLLLQGTGSLSFIRRFTSKAEADDWFYAEAIINSEVDKVLLKVDVDLPKVAPRATPKLAPKAVAKKDNKLLSGREVLGTPAKIIEKEKSVVSKPLSKMLKMGSKEK